jgi:organic hydroperoxide reductase OsmC/OhrA
MSEHRVTVSWRRKTPDFTYDGHDRTHQIRFGGGVEIDASSAPEYRGKAELPNPEEELVAAMSTCHMLTFLAIAARRRLVVDRYEDEASGVLEKNEAGRLAITRATLRPRATFSGQTPTADELAKLHESAHANCFIASSVRTEIAVEPRS